METSEASNLLLKNKYDFHKSPGVESAAKRIHGRTGDRVSQNPLVRIQNYLNRFHEITDREDLNHREHGMDAIKRFLYHKYIIKPDEIPEGYWENQKRIIRERGQGAELEQVDWNELKRQNTEAVIADQKSSLDKWIDYLASPDASYISDGLKYYALRSILAMGEYDKEKKAYPGRSKGTTKPFPDLNREALSYVLDAIEKKYTKQHIDLTKLEKKDQEQFEKLIVSENFAKLYAFAIEKVTPASPESLIATRGEWVQYRQGSDHMPLVVSLQGHGTGWCTAGESTAATQLKGGDFYVYYSIDNDGKPTIPRAAIRMEENKIAEVRGIAAEQNLDSLVVPVVEEKLKSFPDGPLYKRKVSDMRFLTAIDRKVKVGQPLDGTELTFLYELNSTIEGFGYEKDPRIKELRSQRNSEEDMPIVFSCSRDQIAKSISEIRSDTKAYVGPLQTGIFDRLKGVEHVYTSFPEGKIRRQTVEIGGKTTQQLEAELKQKGINISEYAKEMLHSSDFTTLGSREELDTVRLKVQDLGLKGGSTTDQVYARAKELGLELCPAEVGPHIRLKDTNQSLADWYWIAMKQIADRSGHPGVFGLDRRGEDGVWLDGDWAEPANKWNPGSRFVFGLRKSETQNTQTPGFLDRIFKR